MKKIEWSVDFRKSLGSSITLLLFLLFGIGCSRPSFEAEDSIKNFTRHLNKNINQLMNRYDVPGAAIAIVQEGELVWSGAYGYADIEQNRKMTVDAICRAESISKSVTAWGVMNLVEQGIIDLDAPAQKYLNNFELPESEYPIQDVTIRRLLSNSAGLPLGTLGEEYEPRSSMPSLREYLAREMEIVYEPGSAFVYSNVGFNLIELVVEEVTGRNFGEYMSSEVLTPLGMDNSSYTWNEKWATTIPMGYDLHGNPVSPYVYPAKASGGLFATVEDIARFVSAGTNSIDNFVLNKQTIREIYTHKVITTALFGFVADSYGYGHFIETLSDGKQAVWHGGQGHGWMTHFHFVPETGDGIVIFTNSQRSWPMIAHILDDWSAWSGIGPVKFSRIVLASIVLWLIIGSVFLFSLWRIGKIIVEVKTGKRVLNFSPLVITKQRVLDFLLGVVSIIILIWAFAQDYLFISSIFPVGATWLAWALLCFCLALLTSALVPTITLSHTK